MKIASLLLSAVVWCCNAWGAVPQSMGYQGFLTSATGTLICGDPVVGQSTRTQGLWQTYNASASVRQNPAT